MRDEPADADQNGVPDRRDRRVELNVIKLSDGCVNTAAP